MMTPEKMIRQFAGFAILVVVVLLAARAASPQASLNREKAVADHLIQTLPENYPYD